MNSQLQSQTLSLVNYLIKNNLTISAAESISGGLFSSTLTSISGVSKVFKGGIVSYSPSSKKEVLKIDSQTVDIFKTVSYQTAQEMAAQVRKLFDSSISISFTGNAGPLPIDEKPLGLTYISIALPNKEPQGYEFTAQATERNAIREEVVSMGISLLIKELGIDA